jgi:lipopolysaccharide export system protein LptC
MTTARDPAPPAELRLIGPTDRRNAMSRSRFTRQVPAPDAIVRRTWFVGITKRLLPLVALALLTIVALWPEIDREALHGRLAGHIGLADPQNGVLNQARYNGVDEQGRRYTVTADEAHQVTPDRIDLTAPIGDLTLFNGTWVTARSRTGVYLQQTQQLDLSGDVQMYRDDGITLFTDSAAIDLKAGIAASDAKVHVEGPFGTLDAQGFTLLDRGTIIQFTGPGRLILNGHPK